MNSQNIYEGLEMEPANPVPAIEQIRLRARIVDPTHFVFIPENWEAALKPYKKAKWDHGKDQAGLPAGYELKRGNYLVFPQFPIGILDAGFYIARLYMVVKEMEQGEQAYGEMFKDRMEITQNRQRVTLNTNSLGGIDSFYHAILGH